MVRNFILLTCSGVSRRAVVFPHRQQYHIVGDVILVLDTNVIVAATRSPSGASAALLKAARRGKIKMLANVALALEYEATCRRVAHCVAAGLSPDQVGISIDAVIGMARAGGDAFFVATAVAAEDFIGPEQ